MFGILAHFGSFNQHMGLNFGIVDVVDDIAHLTVSLSFKEFCSDINA